MIVPTINFEGRKTSYRQTREGVVVSLVIHPTEVPDSLATAPLGQRYMVVLAAIGDDEQPLPVKQETPSDRSVKAKEKYASSTARQQALVRAARLPKDPRFQQWAWELYGVPNDEEGAITLIRNRCGGTRKNIDIDRGAYDAFILIETDFKVATGQMPEVR